MRRPIAYFACMATISIISVFSILSSTTIIFVNALSTITKKELEAVHTNIHSHCRNIETQEYNTLREYACVNTPNMEWFDREEEEYVEDFVDFLFMFEKKKRKFCIPFFSCRLSIGTAGRGRRPLGGAPPLAAAPSWE